MNCQYCDKKLSKNNLLRHERACKNNPENIKSCPVCNTNFTGTSVTCSYSCSNTYFNKLRNVDDRLTYRALCFRYHKKECIVCGENKIISVHHDDHNHLNDSPDNLIPLCPTHHQYIHSRYSEEVQPIIDKYLKEWKQNNLSVV